MVTNSAPTRLQTGVRIDRRLLKVLKAVAEYRDVTLSALLEEMLLAAMAGKPSFDEDALGQIQKLKDVYGLSA